MRSSLVISSPRKIGMDEVNMLPIQSAINADSKLPMRILKLHVIRRLNTKKGLNQIVNRYEQIH